MLPFRPQNSNFVKVDGKMNRREEVIYSNTLPAPSQKVPQFVPRRDFRGNPKICVVQEPLHNCTPLKPFVNFYQLQQSQKYLNKEWNEMNMDDRYKKIQKERDQDDVIRNFKPEPAYDMLPINTRCHQITLNNPNRTTLGSTKGIPFKNI